MNEYSGLTQTEAKQRLSQYGHNILPEVPPTHDLIILLRQIQSPLIYILIIAAGVSFLLGDPSDSLVIMLAVVVNTTLGFYQERKAEHGLAALKKMLTPRTRVIRDGQQQEILARDLVPGDLVIVTPGDRVPADGVLVEVASLTINEAILTGESVPVSKESSDSASSGQAQWAVRSGQLEKIEAAANSQQQTVNTIFMGTTVVAGTGKFIVTGTGLKTEIGKIATTLSETEEEQTPLQKRFADLAKTLTWLVVVAAGVIFGIGALKGESWVEMFTTSVAVAVAAIPEGLVIALTAILALGMQRILKRKALVRKLIVAETLGTVTVIATDKTGTLTEGKLKVVKTYFKNRDEALSAATFSNQLVDPLELALWEWLTAQPGFDPEELLSLHKRRFIVPFDSQRRYSASVYDHYISFLGAPEVLLSESNLSAKDRKQYEKLITEWASQGLRILALGNHKIRNSEHFDEFKSKPDLSQVNFVGLIGFADPVRSGVKEALDVCREAGIAVKVVTGDYRLTAESILKQVGIHITHPESQIIEGEELEKLTLEELRMRVKSALLFARVTPTQKLKIVEALKSQKEVVALLGDGVNDAPAIKRADIGIVVGDASDVARETADLVLLDSNFATIVAAVEEGRGIFTNIQKVVTYLLGDTFAEVILIFLGLFFGVPLPLTAAQILWINLVTDTLPTLALTMEPREKHLLKRKPIDSNLPIISRGMFGIMGVTSVASGVVMFLIFMYLLTTSGKVEMARAITFAGFSLKSLVYVFALRDSRKFIWQVNPFSNRYLLLAVGVSLLLLLIGIYTPALRQLLDAYVLSGSEWGIIVGASLLIVVLIELFKLLRQILSR